MKSWAATSGSRLRALPRPSGVMQAHCAGSDSDQVLLLGSGPAVGWGETTHDTALAGSLARSLALRTARGADVDVVSSPTMTAQSAIAALEDVILWRYEAIVVSLGAVEAFDLVTQRSFRRHLGMLVAHLASAASHDTSIVLVGLPPLRALDAVSGAYGSVATRHARSIDDIIADTSEEFSAALFVPLQETIVPVTAGDGDGYAEWGDTIAEALAPQLQAARTSAPQPNLPLTSPFV